jgi:fatty acid desaturase
VLGAAGLLLALPYLAFQIAVSTTVHKLDEACLGLVARAKRALSWSGLDALVAHPGDGFIFPAFLWLAVALPALCVHEAFYARAHGFVLWRALLYNAVRIGPMYVNFAHAYTLAHKESHAHGAIFPPALNRLGLCYAFNWVSGPFFGVLPGTFTHSHQLNHHRYHNGVADVYSTAGYRRDSLVSFCRYACVWVFYASNVSTMLQLAAERRWRALAEVAAATAYYCALVLGMAAISPAWAAASLLWAFVEGNILLCMVNWVWHCFIEPSDPLNPYVVSTTIVRGKEFIFNEEFHAVHHAFPGLHWQRYPEAFAKGVASGGYKKAIMLQDENLFVVWGTIVAGDFAALAKLVHDPAGDWDPKELPAVLAARLQHTTW